MYYFETEDAQIYADIAYRLGKVVVQYENFSSSLVPSERFDVTLYLSILQSLLTNCKEHIDRLNTEDRHPAFKKLLGDPTLIEWGLDAGCWVENTFNEEQNLENFITRLRNSMSHPTKISLESETSPTGYGAVKNSVENIDYFIFINSPDVSPNTNTIVEHTRKKSEDMLKKSYNCFPTGVKFKEGKVKDKGHFYLDDKPFIRLSKIKLEVDQLKAFVKTLANFLAQPVQTNWDGENNCEFIGSCRVK